MDMEQLRLFVTVAHYSSMSRAASELSISQSAVSQSISRMEDELGVKLFTRKYRGLVLCEAGRSFYGHAMNILGELDDARREITEQKGTVSGTIHLRVLVASALIPRLLFEFLRLYPLVQFEMVQQHNMDDFDLSISATTEEIPEGGEFVLDEEIVLAVPSSDHSFSARSSVRLEEARNEKYIMMRQGSPLRVLCNKFCRQAGFEPKVVFEGDNPSVVREMISMGLGVAFLPCVSWHNIVDENIHLLHIGEPDCRRRVYITSPRSRRESVAVSTFKAYAITYFSRFAAPRDGEGHSAPPLDPAHGAPIHA